MKSILKTKMLAGLALAILVAGLTGCSEGAYTPSPSNAQVGVPNQFIPNTNQTGFPQQVYPNGYPNTVGQYPQQSCQPVMQPCMSMNPNVCAQLRMQAMMQSQMRCGSRIQYPNMCNPHQGGVVIGKSGSCTVRKMPCMSRKPYYKNGRIVYVVVACNSKNNLGNDVVDSSSDSSVVSSPSSSSSSSSTTGSTSVDKSSTVTESGSTDVVVTDTSSGSDKSPLDRVDVNTKTDEDLPLSERDNSNHLQLEGKDARKVYERLALTPKEKDGLLIKIAPNIFCTMIKREKQKDIQDSDFNCYFAIRTNDPNEERPGEALNIPRVSKPGEGLKDKQKKPYQGDSISIGTDGTSDKDEGVIVIKGVPGENDPAKTMYEELNVDEKKDQEINEDPNFQNSSDKPRGTLKIGQNIKCYHKDNMYDGGYECIIRLNTENGVIKQAKGWEPKKSGETPADKPADKPADEPKKEDTKDVRKEVDQTGATLVPSEKEPAKIVVGSTPETKKVEEEKKVETDPNLKPLDKSLLEKSKSAEGTAAPEKKLTLKEKRQQKKAANDSKTVAPVPAADDQNP